MKKIVFSTFILGSMLVHAQQEIIALTGKGNTQIDFKDIRNLNGNVYLESNENVQVFSQTLRKKFSESRASVHHAQSPSMASLAVDKSGENSLYIPMFSSNLYVLNNRSKEISLVENDEITSSACNIGSHITRMTLAANGKIYVISNDGSQFIEISQKNNKYSLKNLGSIEDIHGNKEQSLSKLELGYGGDMVADENGDLIILSASQHVFRISIENKTSELIGKIVGLPENYSLNGAAVNHDGKIIVGSAMSTDLYEIDFTDLKAKPSNISNSNVVYDLASTHILQRKSNNAEINQLITNVEIFPTKTKDFIQIKFGGINIETATVDVYNLSGTLVKSESINTITNGKAYKIELEKLVSGLYIVNITNEKGEKIKSQKIIIE